MCVVTALSHSRETVALFVSSQHEPACGVHGKSLTFAAFRDSFYSPSRTKVGRQIRWHECAFSSRCQHGRSVHHHCADVSHLFFLFLLTSSLWWPTWQPPRQTVVSKSVGPTIVEWIRSLRIRNNEDGLEIAIHFLWQLMASCTSLAWNVCQNQGKLRHEGRQCFRCGRVARRMFFREGGSCVKDFLRRVRKSTAVQVTGTN